MTAERRSDVTTSPAFGNHLRQGIEIGQQHFKKIDCIPGILKREIAPTLGGVGGIVPDILYFLGPLFQGRRNYMLLRHETNLIPQPTLDRSLSHGGRLKGAARQNAGCLDILVEQAGFGFPKIRGDVIRRPPRRITGWRSRNDGFVFGQNKNIARHVSFTGCIDPRGFDDDRMRTAAANPKRCCEGGPHMRGLQIEGNIVRATIGTYRKDCHD